jgi:hypothetical protein
MALFKLLVKGFEFPASLPGKNSNFRFVFQLRHFDAAAETWVTTESVSPGLTTYWECDASKATSGGTDAKYVRDGSKPRFGQLSPWDEVVLLVNSSELFQMRIVVYDVNRADWVDQLRELGEGLLGALVGGAKFLPIPSGLAAPVGTILGKLRDAAVERLARKDTTLFALTYEFGSNQDSQSIDLPNGGYTMRLALVTSGRSAETRSLRSGTRAAQASGRIDTATAYAYVPPATVSRSSSPRNTPRKTPRKATRRR